jgi:hypothetical protein
MLRYLVSGEAASFLVEPGDHTVEVLVFEGRFGIYWQRRLARCNASVSLEAGEQIDLTWGTRSEIVHLWKSARGQWEVYMILYLVVCVLASGLGWLLGSYLREALALALWHLPNNGMLVPLAYRMIGPLFSAFWPLLLHFWVLHRWPEIKDTSDKALLSRFGSPYYLEVFGEAKAGSQ